MKKKIKILQIITATTQVLDCTIPIFYKLNKESPGKYDITILYCSLNKGRFIRNTRYYSDIDSFLHVKSVDLSDFEAFSSSAFVKLYKLLIRSSLEDTLSVISYLKNFEFFGFNGIKYLFAGYKKRLEDYIVERLLDAESLLRTLSPDIILFDNRTTFKIAASRMIAEYITSSDLRTIIIPHAPHGDNYYDEFIPVSGDQYPKNIEYWGMLKAAKPNWVYNKKGTSSFYPIGFTPLDTSWGRYIDGVREIQHMNRESNRRYILYIPQKVHGKSFRGENTQFDIISYEEELQRMNQILAQLDRVNLHFEFVIKPHPRISSATIRNLVHDTGHSSVKLSEEPLYYHMERADFVISEFSSAILYCMCNVPVLLITGKLYEEVSQYWHVLDKLFSGISYHYDLDTLALVLESLNDRERYRQIVQANRKHLSEFYYLEAVDRAKARLEGLELDNFIAVAS